MTTTSTNTTTTNPTPDVPLPTGVEFACDWQSPGYRVVFGIDQQVTDHPARVYTSAIQMADGSIDDGDVEAPHIHVANGETEGLHPLNSDQARLLASCLLEAADEIDGWAQR